MALYQESCPRGQTKIDWTLFSQKALWERKSSRSSLYYWFRQLLWNSFEVMEWWHFIRNTTIIFVSYVTFFPSLIVGLWRSQDYEDILVFTFKQCMCRSTCISHLFIFVWSASIPLGLEVDLHAYTYNHIVQIHMKLLPRKIVTFSWVWMSHICCRLGKWKSVKNWTALLNLSFFWKHFQKTFIRYVVISRDAPEPSFSTFYQHPNQSKGTLY